MQASTILKAQREAKAEGFLEGQAIGIEKGIEQGLEKVALNMLKAKLPVESIVAMTGLSAEFIAQLKTKI